MVRKTGPIHFVACYGLGYVTWCEKDTARVRWSHVWEEVTCEDCRRVGVVRSA
jgi:hypothetical protein